MKNISLRLPDYEVLIHIKVNEFSKHLEKEIESLTARFALEESTEDSGYRDYHWEFKTWEETVSAGEKLKHLVTNPNLILLKVKNLSVNKIMCHDINLLTHEKRYLRIGTKSNYNHDIKPISHKA